MTGPLRRAPGPEVRDGGGLAEPLAFTKELTGFEAGDVRKIMRDNVTNYLVGNVRVGAATVVADDPPSATQ